jgi:hypothetical protein
MLAFPGLNTKLEVSTLSSTNFPPRPKTCETLHAIPTLITKTPKKASSPHLRTAAVARIAYELLEPTGKPVHPDHQTLDCVVKFENRTDTVWLAAIRASAVDSALSGRNPWGIERRWSWDLFF